MNSIKSFLINAFKSFNIIVLIFLFLSIYLIRQDNIYAIVLGYISIVWWSLIVVINIYKNSKKNSNTLE
jgi:hypothetical protein